MEIISTQQWFGQWRGAVGNQAIAWANVDNTASLGHNKVNIMETRFA